MELEELLTLIRDAWPQRFERGLVTHIHRNALELPDGSRVHLRVLIQALRDENRPDDGRVEVNLT